MKAILFDRPGDESVLRLGETEPPAIGPGEVRIRVHATALNRADLLQRQGRYPPPAGASPILGLECAGLISEAGPEVSGWVEGDRVMALLPGGGYADEVVVDAGSVMKVPDRMSLEEAAAIPETFLTAYLNVFVNGAPPAGGLVLVHGGGSGVGTATIALGGEAGLIVAVTAGSDMKCSRCLQLGATLAVNYRTHDFVEVVTERFGESKVNVVLDHMGGLYLNRDLQLLAPEGRVVLIGSMGGAEGHIDTSMLLRKRASIIGSVLRSRSAAEKAEIVGGFIERFGDGLRMGRIRPVVDRVLPLAEASQAHRLMAESGHFGKIVLRVAAE